MVGILPFCEQQALWEQIVNPFNKNRNGNVRNPPCPADGTEPMARELSTLVDSGSHLPLPE